MRKIVLLPDPFGPSRPTISPGSMANETSVTARRGPYHFVTCCARMIGAMNTQTPISQGKKRDHRTQSRAQRPGSFHFETTERRGPSLVEFGRVLVRLERVGIVRIDDVGA